VASIGTAIQQRLEVLKTVGVDAPVDVFRRVVKNRMGVLPGKTLIRGHCIGVESRNSFNMLLDLCNPNPFAPSSASRRQSAGGARCLDAERGEAFE
jgi:hypothetical protein